MHYKVFGMYVLLKLLLLYVLTIGGQDKQDAKARVNVIHTIKDQLKQQNEIAKQLKKDLKDIQDKIKAEKEVFIKCFMDHM